MQSRIVTRSEIERERGRLDAKYYMRNPSKMTQESAQRTVLEIITQYSGIAKDQICWSFDKRYPAANVDDMGIGWTNRAVTKALVTLKRRKQIRWYRFSGWHLIEPQAGSIGRD